LDSTYDAEWKGPWIGFDLRFMAREITTFAHRFEPYFTYGYHWADYHAEADWNLRDDFAHPKSFEHDADGTGWKIGTGFNVWLHPNWALNFNYDYQDWSTDGGTDKVFFSDGSTAKTKLNEVNWTSYALSLGVSLRF
jgi:outer membrane autotransporter protein